MNTATDEATYFFDENVDDTDAAGPGEFVTADAERVVQLHAS